MIESLILTAYQPVWVYLMPSTYIVHFYLHFYEADILWRILIEEFLYIIWCNTHSQEANELSSHILGSGFKLISLFTFWQITWKRCELCYIFSCGLNITNTILQEWLWYSITLEFWMSLKKSTPQKLIQIIWKHLNRRWEPNRCFHSGQKGHGHNGNEGVHYTSQISKTEVSPQDVIYFWN